MKFFNEFKQFAIKGNAIDLAVGIVIGAAFSGVVNSLVKDILTPPIGKLLGGVDFTELYINLSGEKYNSFAAAREAGAATINYGLFLNAIISFLIIAWALFIVVKFMNRLKQEESPPSPNAKVCEACKSKIDIHATRCAYCTSDV